MLTIGFTGTRDGMTEKQLLALSYILEKGTKDNVYHHGDCIGADAQFHDMCEARGFKIVIHPPINPMFRAFKKSEHMFPEKEYLDRNRDIVKYCLVIIGCPKSRENRSGGTWFTLRQAVRSETSKDVYIIYPDGEVVDAHDEI